MPETKEFPLYGDGFRGVVISAARYLDDRRQKLVRLDNGSEFMVPSEDLEPQPDGTFYLRRLPSAPPEAPAPPASPPASASQAPPPSAPTSPPTAAPPPTRPDQLFRHGYNVQRVPVDRIIDEPVGPRQEGDTMIYPVVEEVLVVEKRFVLREEIHVTPEKAAIEARKIDAPSRSRRTA